MSDATVDDTDEATDPADREPTHAVAVLSHIARSLVESPDDVRVDVDHRGHKPQLNLRVGDGDMGRIIGKRGRMANAIRIVTRAAAARDGVEIDVEFVD